MNGASMRFTSTTSLVSRLYSAGQEKMVLELAGRAHRYLEKAAELRIPASPAALGDIGGNGDASAANLTRQPVQLCPGKPNRALVNRQRQRMRFPPNLQLPKVLHTILLVLIVADS